MIMDKLTAIVHVRSGKENAFEQDWEPFIKYWNQKQQNKNVKVHKLIIEMI